MNELNRAAEASVVEAIERSGQYRVAFKDQDFIAREELRGVRVMLEMLKPELALKEHRIESTIVVFGGTQVVEKSVALARLEAAKTALTAAPSDKSLLRSVERAERVLAKSRYYDAAREFARIVASSSEHHGRFRNVVMTGGGPGIMEAANRGAHDVGVANIALNITLPEEQHPNPYISPHLCFQFHYFAIRKMHFLLRARALVVFPGGFGTLDELFEVLTLRQTKRMQEIPVILFGKEYWQNVVDFDYMASEGVIADAHKELVSYAETPYEAWDMIERFHASRGED